jgi:SAM-dependent methyltransferase
MPGKSWYKDWFSSPYYHKLYFERDDKEAEAFIKKLIEHLRPVTGSRMLDVACGRGRHSKILASMGYSVTGIDISGSSITYAKQFVQKDSFGEKDNPDFFVHDMRLPFWVNYFNYAFNFFTSFGYFSTRREHDDAIRTIANSLRPGGIFVIDYLNVHYAEDQLIQDETKQVGSTTYRIHRWDDETHFYKKVIMTDEALPAPLEYTEKVAKFSLGDFTDMLAYQGMQVQEVFGDYRFSSYDVRKTPRLIVVAKK